MAKSDAKDANHETRDKSWVPGQKGQGGEGFSKGYGGSGGRGTGASGPDEKKPTKRSHDEPHVDKP
jgi:hypothetical protein